MGIKDIDSVILDIDIPGITEALIEVMGEEHRQKITERIENTTFFGRGSNELLMNCIEKRISTLTEYRDSLLMDKNKSVELEKITTKIDTLQKVKQQIDKLSKTHESLEKEKDAVLRQMIEEKTKTLPVQHPTVIREFCYMCKEPFNEELDDYYFKVFAPFFGNPKTKEELCENPDFKIMLQYAKEINEVEKDYDKRMDLYSPLTVLGIEKLESIGLKNYQTKEEIKRNFLSPFAFILSEGSTFMEEGLDGKMKTIVGINLGKNTCDRNIIHELIHAICSFEKDGKYISGFCSKENLHTYSNINEACVDSLAIKVLKKYLEKNYPMYNPEIAESVYSKCFDVAGDFLETYEKELIDAILSDNPLSFREKIGAQNFDKINAIMGKAMNDEPISQEEKRFMEGMSCPTA